MTIYRGRESALRVRDPFRLESVAGLTDGELLRRFTGRAEEAPGLAFEALMARHGPMVLGVCRSVLRDPDDAQDAFQATFFVLVRKAGSIRDGDSVASWLHGVALRVASHLRSDSARRRRHERIKGEMAGSPRVAEARDDGPGLHEEVGRLPERFRAPVVLCYLEGHTCEDAARLLRLPVGTVKSRLARARERLHRRLTRCGQAAFPALGRDSTAPPLPVRLSSATAEIAVRFRAGVVAPTQVSVALAEGVLGMMRLAKLKMAKFALIVTATVVGASAARTAGTHARAGQAVPEERGKPGSTARENPSSVSGPAARLAPRNVSVRAGSGTALTYALDERGKRISERAGGDPEEGQPARGRPRPIPVWKEVGTDLRWVAVVGVLDNQAIREAQAQTRKIAISAADPQYKRIDVERQTREPGGQWSDWRSVDRQRSYRVLDNLPEVARERTPEQVRPSALVDPLPFLKKGVWEGVDPDEMPRLPEPRTEDTLPVRQPRNEKAPVLMIRHLDFTGEPGEVYRYRVRVVLVNPEAKKDGIKELFGPWSEPTAAIQTP